MSQFLIEAVGVRRSVITGLGNMSFFLRFCNNLITVGLRRVKVYICWKGLYTGDPKSSKAES